MRRFREFLLPIPVRPWVILRQVNILPQRGAERRSKHRSWVPRLDLHTSRQLVRSGTWSVHLSGPEVVLVAHARVESGAEREDGTGRVLVNRVVAWAEAVALGINFISLLLSCFLAELYFFRGEEGWLPRVTRHLALRVGRKRDVGTGVGITSCLFAADKGESMI